MWNALHPYITRRVLRTVQTLSWSPNFHDKQASDWHKQSGRLQLSIAPAGRQKIQKRENIYTIDDIEKTMFITSFLLVCRSEEI